MFTDEMMLHRLFNRVCENQLVTTVSYRSESSTMLLASTIENPVTVKVVKFKSIENFILGIAQGNYLRMRFLIRSPLTSMPDKYEPSFLLKTPDGEVKITFRNS